MNKDAGKKAIFPHLNNMETIIKFIKQNAIGLGIGAVFYTVFLVFTYSGNRICDCETTENYKPSTYGRGTSVSRFYHK